MPVALQQDTVNDNYTFTYDGNNRVSKIIYTTNNHNFAPDTAGENITFDYSNFSQGGLVIKTINYVNLTSHPVIEIDSFYVNGQGLITQTNTPGLTSSFEYTYSSSNDPNNGILMSRKTLTYNTGGGITIASSQIYNSNGGNFLDYSYDGTLTANISNALSTPISISWATSLGTVTHNPSNGGLTDVLSNYSGLPVTVMATGNGGGTASGYYPGNIYPTEAYTVYNNLAYRTGDYLQLQSFTLWGYSLYQNSNLVKSIINTGYTTTVSYTIDAYNKITQMRAVVTDSLSNTKTTVYNLQYEIY
jgi:hypothetical protein